MLQIPIPRQILVLGLLMVLVQATIEAQEKPQLAATQADIVRLKLNDGSYLVVDEAWETSQGIWYRQGGLSHLAPKDRVKSIDRKAPVAPKTESRSAQAPVTVASNNYDRPAWIYLVGGARVEADSATESPAGVWYKRGSLTIFIEHSRIDRIEREDLEKIADSDSPDSKQRGWSTGNPKLDGLIRQNGNRYGVDPYLIFLVMEQESHFNTRVVSPKGARGLMQLMPGTSARFGVRRPHDPAQNISGGTRYLKQLLDQFSNRVDLVLASYNAGEGAVRKFGGKVPPYRETRDYVKRISFRYKRTIARHKAESAEAVASAGER